MEDESEKFYEHVPQDEFWTEHRTTLISYETQFVSGLKPQTEKDKEKEKEREKEDPDIKRQKCKKKNIEYEGGFLFPGKAGDKEENISAIILTSKYNSLRRLFEVHGNLSKEQARLREFVKIMLQLKHSVILKEFLQIYEVIIRDIWDMKFQAVKEELDRVAVVEEIMNKVAGFVQKSSYIFPFFAKYLKENHKETVKFFQVTTYCFIGEWYSFSINEFYCQAFEVHEEDNKTKKKKKTQELDEVG